MIAMDLIKKDGTKEGKNHTMTPHYVFSLDAEFMALLNDINNCKCKDQQPSDQIYDYFYNIMTKIIITYSNTNAKIPLNSSPSKCRFILEILSSIKERG